VRRVWVLIVWKCSQTIHAASMAGVQWKAGVVHRPWVGPGGREFCCSAGGRSQRAGCKPCGGFAKPRVLGLCFFLGGPDGRGKRCVWGVGVRRIKAAGGQIDVAARFDGPMIWAWGSEGPARRPPVIGPSRLVPFTRRPAPSAPLARAGPAPNARPRPGSGGAAACLPAPPPEWEGRCARREATRAGGKVRAPGRSCLACGPRHEFPPHCGGGRRAAQLSHARQRARRRVARRRIRRSSGRGSGRRTGNRRAGRGAWPATENASAARRPR
jgi:hypothetical protein